MSRIEDCLVDARMPTKFGTFQLFAFPGDDETKEDLALVMGDIEGRMLVRVHSECFTGDVLHSMRCDCGEQLDLAMERIAQEGKGIVVYSRQEGRGIGLHAKIQAYHLQDKGADTLDANLMLGLPADARDYRIAARMLESLGISRVSLLTNNPDKVEQLISNGIDVVERRPLVVGIDVNNRSYLATKAERMGHHINDEELNGG